MMVLQSVHFDNRIPNWRHNLEVVNFNILALMIEGKVRYTLNQRTVIAEKGELLFIPAGTHRSSENFEGEHQKITVLFHHGEEEAHQVPYLANGQFAKCNIRNFEYIKRRFEKLYFETVGDDKFHALIVAGILLELVGLAARELELADVTPSKLKLAHELQQYLVTHYREPIHIDQLAALIHRSANYTISLFREVIGPSPIQYVHLLRVKEACSLLTNSDLSVAEIADYLGYYDHSYFFRIFKKHTSLSPTDYRQSSTYSQNLQIF